MKRPHRVFSLAQEDAIRIAKASESFNEFVLTPIGRLVAEALDFRGAVYCNWGDVGTPARCDTCPPPPIAADTGALRIAKL